MTDTDAGYRLLEHTADAGLVAWGRDPASAFEMAALGMYEIVLGEPVEGWGGAGPSRMVSIEVEGQGWADLLVNWLAELVYLFDVEAFIPKSVSFERCAPPDCVATVSGLTSNNDDATMGTGVKAITYHQLRVDVQPDRTELQVIFDI